MQLWRMTYGLTQQDAGDLVGVHWGTWSRWEREITRPSEDHYNAIQYVISYPPPWWDLTSAGELADAPGEHQVGRGR
jgi:transcriptional regulator with XRE-family HTH domain